MRNKKYDVVIKCNDFSTAEIVKAEIIHKLAYPADIVEVIT